VENADLAQSAKNAFVFRLVGLGGSTYIDHDDKDWIMVVIVLFIGTLLFFKL